jgi:hypothetical protein
MTMKTRLTIALACGGMLAAASGCAQAPDEQPTAETARRKPTVREHASTSVTAPSPPREAGQAPPTGDELLSRMADDLAKRLGVRKTELQVLAMDTVVWNDGALGCPQPDKMYTQATVPGLRVLFQHNLKTYQYHGSERGHFVYCENPAEPAGNFDRQ